MLERITPAWSQERTAGVSYTISLAINLFTINEMGVAFPSLGRENCKENIARNSCLSFYVLTGCWQNVRITTSVPLEAGRKNLIARV